LQPVVFNCSVKTSLQERKEKEKEKKSKHDTVHDFMLCPPWHA
jgi:hypothetical protein